ncbi:hypothetical protein EVAR_3130_1 [Eumeta japonica]|uniref:Uncharacterized protein n=1 Tax=Eumeta variegata TaxID=151549 RepID=A0A4C1XG79_EUMVA|nr:hypothetical protein EVAR_3130_1 [Eumeta japonica]
MDEEQSRRLYGLDKPLNVITLMTLRPRASRWSSGPRSGHGGAVDGSVTKSNSIFLKQKRVKLIMRVKKRFCGDDENFVQCRSVDLKSVQNSAGTAAPETMKTELHSRYQSRARDAARRRLRPVELTTIIVDHGKCYHHSKHTRTQAALRYHSYSIINVSTSQTTNLKDVVHQN